MHPISELNTDSQLEPEETACLCGAPMEGGVCSVEGCVCSAAPAHAVMTKELFDLMVGGDGPTDCEECGEEITEGNLCPSCTRDRDRYEDNAGR